VPGRYLTGREGEDGRGFVQFDQPFDIAIVGPFHEQEAKIFRPLGRDP
jgi:hypothetical protein